MTGKRKKTRLSIELPPRLRARLEQVKTVSEADSLSEVIRRALAVYDHLWSEKAKGGELIIRNDDGEKTLILL